MTIKRVETEDTHEGTGVVLREDGTQVGVARYRLFVERQILDAATFGNPDAEVGGLRQINGSIGLTDRDPFGVPIDLIGAQLTLRLEDNRSVTFFWENNSGDVVVSGPIHPA